MRPDARDHPRPGHLTPGSSAAAVVEHETRLLLGFFTTRFVCSGMLVSPAAPSLDLLIRPLGPIRYGQINCIGQPRDDASCKRRDHSGLSSIPPGSVTAACSADYACTTFPTKTLSDPSACGVSNRRGIRHSHQIVKSNEAQTDSAC